MPMKVYPSGISNNYYMSLIAYRQNSNKSIPELIDNIKDFY